MELTWKQIVGAFFAGAVLVNLMIPKSAEQKAAEQTSRAKAQVEEQQREQKKAELQARQKAWDASPQGRAFWKCRQDGNLFFGEESQAGRLRCGNLHGHRPDDPLNVVLRAQRGLSQ